MHYTTLFLAVAPLLAAAQLSLPWKGPVGPVPRFECTCHCEDDITTTEKVTRDLCAQAVNVGRMKDIKVLEDGTCALWGLEIQLFPDEVGNSWSSEVCSEYKGCKAVGVCNYVTCSGIQKTEWTPPAIPSNGDGN
ncbi:hypothetical protein TWF696_003806 [Orbilia brochopaga]|uniref:Uncharacterized protein n=1 Tax=Orbilia brochopaga TaxID=3140254 RepID=A0AAV9V4C3_9PEZI